MDGQGVGHISTVFVHKVMGVFSAGGRDRRELSRALLQDVGVDLDAPVDPKSMIRDTEFFDLLERVVREDEDGRSIPVRVGAAMRCDEYGAFGLAFKSATDLWGSFQRVERFGRVVTSIANFRVLEGGGSSFIEVIKGREDRLGLQMTNELAVAAATALSREVCREEFAPKEVCFAHESPRDPAVSETHFGCPVRYRAARDGIEIPDSLLRCPNRLGDTGISAYFDTQLEAELANVPDERNLQSRVCVRIAQSLSEGVPTLEEIALGLGMSRRTLQRRLSDQELSFKTLVDESRRQLAEHLLSKSQYPLNEIAFLTGFSEQSAFNRAFKRWAGTTPRSYRLDTQPR